MSFPHRATEERLAEAGTGTSPSANNWHCQSPFSSPCSGMLRHTSRNISLFVSLSLVTRFRDCLITGKHYCFGVPDVLPWTLLPYQTQD